MRGIFETPIFQLLAEKLGEEHARIAVAVFVGDKNRVTFEPVAKMVLLPFILPILDEAIGHRVVMN